MSEQKMLYCLIAFILGWLVSKYMGDGFRVGGVGDNICLSGKCSYGPLCSNLRDCDKNSSYCICPDENKTHCDPKGKGKCPPITCSNSNDCKLDTSKGQPPPQGGDSAPSSSNDSSPPSSPVSESKSNSKTNCENISCGGKKFGSGTNNKGIDVSGKSVCPWNVCPKGAPYVNLKGGGCAKNPHDFPDCCNSKKCNADVDYNIPGYCGYNWKYYRRYCKRGQDCFNWFTGDQAGNKPPHGRGPQRKCYVPDPHTDDGFCPDYCNDPDEGIRPH